VASGLRSPQVLRLLLAFLPTFIVTGARAQTGVPERRARLVYVVAPDAQGCPSEQELRAAANARAGHELFGDPASLTLEVNIRRAGAAHVATVVLPDGPDGTGTRELRSDVGCAELATAVALVASLAIDPESILRPPPPPPPPPPPSRTWRGWVGLGPRVGFGPGPLSGGLALSGGVTGFLGGRGTLGAELRGLAPRDSAFEAGQVAVTPLTLAVLPCAARGHLEACGVAAVGLVRGEGAGFTQNFTVWRPFAALGARGGVVLGGERLRLRAFVEVAAVLPRTSFMVGEAEAYTTHGVSCTGGVDGLFFF
jgi:hypothetical protein